MRNMILLSVCMFAFVGCTRPQNETSKLKVSIPAFNKSANLPMASAVGHIVINITGPGISNPIFFEWDREHNSSAATEITPVLDVPTGADRLVQVLAIYEDDTTRAMSFHYGDSTVTLKAPEETIEINAAKINTTAVVTGSISGRYLTATTGGVDQGPTGEVLMKYQPANGKPALILEKTQMANGWFNVFAMAGLTLSYEVNGQVLFGGPIDMANISASDKVARTMIPVHKYKDRNDLVVSNTEPEIHLMGYFGDTSAVANKRVCYDSAGTLGHLYKYNSPNPPGNPDLLPIGTLGAAPSIASLRDTSSPLQAAFLEGGAPKSTPNGCQPMGPNDLYANYLPFSARNFDNGKDEAGGFRGPLGKIDPSNATNYMVDGEPLYVDQVGGNVALFGRLLPGVNEAITKLIVYRIPTPAAGQPTLGDRAPCLDLAVGKFGATKTGEASPTLTGAFTLATQTATGTMTPDEALALCFQGPAGTYARGAVLRSNGAGGGGSNGPYLRIESTDGSAGGASSDGLLLTTGVCHAVRFATYNGMGTPYPVATSTQFTGMPTSGSIGFYSGSSCTGGASNVTIPAGSTSSALVYIKGTAPISPGFLATITSTGDAISFTGTQNRLTVANPILKANHPVSMIPNVCYPIEVSTHYANGFAYPQNLGSALATLDMDGGIGTVYGNETDCMNTSSGNNSPGHIEISGGNDRVVFWVKTSGSAENTASLTVSSAGWSNYGSTFVRTSGIEQVVGAYLRTTMLNPQVGVCSPVRVALVNTNGYEVISRAEIPLAPAVGSLNASLHSDPGCYSALGSNLKIYAGQSATTFYIMPFGSGPISLSNMSSGTPNFTEPPPSATQPAAYLGYNYLGLPNSKVLGSHEFGTQILTLNKPAGGTLSCGKSLPDGNGMQIDCSANLSGNQFTWTAMDAAAGYRFHFFWSNGSQNARTIFDPKAIYGNDFQVIMCSSTISSNSNTSALASNFGANTDVNLCLNSGVVLTCDSPLNLGYRQALIGHSSQNTVNHNSSGTGFSCIDIEPMAAMDGYTTVANLMMTVDATNYTSAIQGIEVRGGGGGATNYPTLISKINFVINSGTYAAKGVSVSDLTLNRSLNIVNSDFNLNGSSGNTYGIYMTNENQGMTTIAKNNVSSNSSSYDVIFLAINRVPTGGSMGVWKIDQNNITGNRIKILNATSVSGSSQFPPIKFTRNYVETGMEPASGPAFNLFGGTGHTIVGNRIKSMGSTFVFGMLTTDSGFIGPFEYEISQNRFLHAGLHNLFATNAAASETIRVTMNQNSFLKTGATGAPEIMNHSGASGGVLEIVGTEPSSATAGNKACYATGMGASDWSNILFGNSGGGTVSPGITLTSSAVNPVVNDSCF